MGWSVQPCVSHMVSAMVIGYPMVVCVLAYTVSICLRHWSLRRSSSTNAKYPILIPIVLLWSGTIWCAVLPEFMLVWGDFQLSYADTNSNYLFGLYGLFGVSYWGRRRCIQQAIWHNMNTDGLAEGYVVLKIPCGIQPLYESGRGERIVKKGREEPDVIRRENRRGTEGTIV